MKQKMLVLSRRLKHLQERIADPTRRLSSSSFDIAEASALKAALVCMRKYADTAPPRVQTHTILITYDVDEGEVEIAVDGSEDDWIAFSIGGLSPPKLLRDILIKAGVRVNYEEIK